MEGPREAVARSMRARTTDRQAPRELHSRGAGAEQVCTERQESGRWSWGSGEISQQDGAREVENMEVSSGASLSFSEIRPAERDMLGALAETVLC